MEREPRTPGERALLLLRATLLPGWQPTPSQGLVWAIRGAIVLGVLALIASTVDKTLWDWLDLLVVPVVLAIGGYLFNSSQNRATQEAAERRAQGEALQGYLDKMSDLLIPDKGQGSLYDQHPPDNLRWVARARTLAVLPRLDADRKGSVVRFLYEARLLKRDHPVIDLSEANLIEANLIDANLSRAHLNRANLSKARLNGANLSNANLTGANLSEAHLGMYETKVVRSGSYYVTPGANLRGADLRGADFREANLNYAEGITNEELEQQARILEGTTMPNGQKYEDWIRSPQEG